MGCVWGEGELWEQSYNLAILTEKKMQSKTTETPIIIFFFKKIQECGLSLRHLVMGILTNWREFRSKQSERGGKASEGSDYPRREAEKSQGWRHFRVEQVEGWDGHLGAGREQHLSRDSLSSHFTALSRYYRISRENIHRDCQKEHPWPGELGTFPQGKSSVLEQARGDGPG